MIFVDRREEELLKEMRDHGLAVELEFGDAMFEGNGAAGKIEVGIERKKVDDLVNCMLDGRLSGHQLPGLLAGYSVVYLVVEGLWRGHPGSGLLQKMAGEQWRVVERGRRKVYAKDVEHYLTTIEMCGVKVRRTTSAHETALSIIYLEQWWGKEWGEHRGHLQMHNKAAPPGALVPGKASLMRRIAKELPGIGWGRSAEVERRFATMGQLMAASEEELLKIEGIGKVTARKVWAALHGGEEEQ